MLLGCVLALAGCTQMQSPDARARQAVETAAAAGFSLPLAAGGTLEIPPGRLSSLSVTTAPLERGSLRGFGRISFEGRVDGRPVSYVGDERFVVACAAASCRLDGAPAPRFLLLLEQLRARRAALEAGDREALAGLVVADALPLVRRADLVPSAERQVAAWFVRIDRDEGLVGEVAEDGGRRQLVLRWVEDEGWRFVSGLP